MDYFNDVLTTFLGVGKISVDIKKIFLCVPNMGLTGLEHDDMMVSD